MSHRVTAAAGINIVVLLISAALTLNIASKFRTFLDAQGDDAFALTNALGCVRLLNMFQAVAMCLLGVAILLLILVFVLRSTHWDERSQDEAALVCRFQRNLASPESRIAFP